MGNDGVSFFHIRFFGDSTATKCASQIGTETDSILLTRLNQAFTPISVQSIALLVELDSADFQSKLILKNVIKLNQKLQLESPLPKHECEYI